MDELTRILSALGMMLVLFVILFIIRSVMGESESTTNVMYVVEFLGFGFMYYWFRICHRMK